MRLKAAELEKRGLSAVLPQPPGDGGPELRRRLLRLRGVLASRVYKYLELLADAEDFIGKIPDSETRQIIRLRFVYGKSWQAVATAIGRSDESYPRKKAARFLFTL
ncbi:MAG: hypothetical protein LBU36_02825 [Clostridiales bacterium]|nr:hypothetical protein [Clostridiales bacterium]